MDRREALRYTAYITGFAISAPTITALFSGCKTDSKGDEGTGYQSSLLSAEEYAFLGAAAETILPATDTPGAKDVGVPEFIDRLVSQGYDEEARERFVKGLQDFMKEADAAHDKPFAELTAEQQLAFLNQADRAMKDQLVSWRDNPPADPKERYQFFRNLKELVILGYFTSEQVGTEVLAYDPVPGVYEPCIPLSSVGKAWALG